jgi:spore maturation protein CgeB
MPPRTLSRVLYAGVLGEGSTARSRWAGLRAVGLDVVEVDTSGWLPPRGRWVRSFVTRAFLHPSVHRMNARLRSLLAERQNDVLWLDKGEWTYPSTLAFARRRGCAIVHYNTDDVLGRHAHSWLHRRGLARSDVYLPTNRHNVGELRRRYGVRAFRAGMGHDPVLLDLRPTPRRDAAAVVYVGHWEPHTEQALLALRAAGIEVGVWGYNWFKARDRSLRQARFLPHADYAATMAGSRIALGFLSRWNRNDSTGRSFEIPALGAFLLAERTPEHEFVYGDGAGAALFSTPAELVAKARHYLAHPDERGAVAAAGHARLKAVGYSWTDHMRREWPLVERLLADPAAALTAADDAPFWPGFRAGAPPPAEAPLRAAREA